MTDKIEVEKLAVMKERENRDLDTLVDENTLVAGETGAGVFGVFKFFQGIRNFFKGIQALGTLVTTSKIPVTDADGNVTYTTPQAIVDAVSEVNGVKDFKDGVTVDGETVSLSSDLDDYDTSSEVTSKINNALANYSNFTYTKISNFAPQGTQNITISEKGVYTISVCLENTAYRLVYTAFKTSFNLNIAEHFKNGLTLEWVNATTLKLTNTTSNTLSCYINIAKIGKCD